MTDLSDLIVFSQAVNEDSAKQILEMFIDISGAHKEKEFSKQTCKQFLDLMQSHFESKDVPSNSKFYTLFMMKIIIDRWQSKIISVLVAHTLLKYMIRLAKQIDPNKPISEKGKSLFKDKQLGNDYIRLLLECLKMFSEKSKSSDESRPTKFRKYYTELEEMKIVLPKEMKFFDMPRSNKTPSVNQVGSVQRSRDSIQYAKQPIPAGRSDYRKSIEMTLNKIETLVESLNNDEEQQVFRLQCQRFHQSFLKENDKYQKIMTTENVTNQNDIQQIIALTDFFNQENALYNRLLANQKDYYSYRQEMLIATETLQSNMGTKPPQTQSKFQERSFKKSQIIPNGSRKNNFAKESDDSNKQLVSKLMSKLEERSKSPNVGFKAIKQSLSKDKSLTKMRRSASGLKKSNATTFVKSMSKSKIIQAFTSPPNLYPRDKQYAGQFIEANSDLEKVMKELSKKQGIRRFITCNFKQKNPLFENTHIQIGIKSEPVYENVNDFKVLIGIEMFIGNKTQELLKNMSITYKGNQDVLLYGNPRTVDSVLMGGYQTKHELLIVPLSYQFPLIKMNIKYSVNNEKYNQSIALPNSILKLAHHGSLEKKQFMEHFRTAIIYRTVEFKWTRHITPESLSKYIKTLVEFTPYDRFIVQASEMDYELGCHVILKQQYEGLLKICIRPNFNAVIQVGVLENNEEALESFIFYIQSLQALLTHVDHHQQTEL